MKKYIYFICRLIIMNKPQSNLPSGDTSIQGTLSAWPRGCPLNIIEVPLYLIVRSNFSTDGALS